MARANGLVLVRELDERLGFNGLIEQHLPILGEGTHNCLLLTCCASRSTLDGGL